MPIGCGVASVLKALQVLICKSGLQSPFPVVQGMLSHWAQIVSSISGTGQRPKIQTIQG